jgi:hypothetical protein
MAYHQGIYKAENPEKYMGDANNIVYRSSWEFKAMRYFDRSKHVLAWASEELIIPYMSPLDKRVHRYFTDFVVKMDTGQTYVIEVKPYDQTLPPKRGKRQQKKSYEKQVMTYIVNEAKWKAAKEYCDDRKLNFMILTEKQLFRKKDGSI